VSDDARRRCASVAQLLLKNGDWPFWLSQAIKNGFMDAHRDCKVGDTTNHMVCESITHTRHWGRKKTVLVAFEDPQIDWLKSQPQSPQDCIRGLVDDAMTRDNPQE